jgi:hypothetical protein
MELPTQEELGRLTPPERLALMLGFGIAWKTSSFP